MADLPPLPPGFKLQGGGKPSRPKDFDPVRPLLDAGVEFTNGYRTSQDTQRLQRRGYTAATGGSHEDGDSVDLTPGKTGWDLARLQAEARKQFGPDANIGIHNGTHVHVTLKGWGQAPGTPGTKYGGIPALPEGAKLLQRGPISSAELRATGQAHDGDTLNLSNGQSGRLLGFDAFELNQMGRKPDGSLVPLGQQSRNALLQSLAGAPRVNPTGQQTYGRPVVSLGDLANDPARNALRQGLGMAEPSYLRGSPLFGPYMEAERLARLNRMGGFQTNAETPSQYRRKDGPWQGAEPGKYGDNAEAVFFDDRTPYGLRPEISQAYNEFSRTAKSAEDLVQFGKDNGFEVPLAQAQKFIASREKAGGKVGEGVEYIKPPRPMTDPGDGAFGSFARGFGDPVNALDEMGGVVDAVGLTPGRENVWSSDRRFGDVLWNNIDQNRAILDHDSEAHPYARMGGQLTSGLALPMGAASTPIRLAGLMGTEGAVAGLMAGEGDLKSRLPNAAAGAVLGTAAGGTLGVAGEHLVSPAVKRVIDFWRARRAVSGDAGAIAADVADEAMPVLNDGLQNAGPTPAARSQPQGGVFEDRSRSAPKAGIPAPRSAAMASAPVPQVASNVVDLPPLPEGFTLDAPFGVTRQTGERLSAEEMAALAQDVDPRGAIPRPGNEVGSLEESIKANPSRFLDVPFPNPSEALPQYTIRGSDLFKSTKRRDVYDVTKFIRANGGIRDDGGELAHLGIDNKPRAELPFGKNEQFLGRLVNNESGMSLDQASEMLWEAGYFHERPTTAELLDVLHGEQRGDYRFHPSDLDTVDEFYHRQAMAGAMHEAEAAGSPYAEDRSHSINLDDLMANAPPASAYEEMPRLTGRVGNINLDRLDKQQDVAALIDQVSKRVGGFDAAARGKVTKQETQRLAVEMGLRPEQLLKRQHGQALNAEQLYASRALVQKSRQVVASLAKKAVGGNDDDVAAFRAAWLKHAALEEQIAGATAEAGRALAQFRILARAKDTGAEAVRSYLKGAGGRESIENAAQAIVDLMEDPAKASHFLREGVKPRWRDKFNELWVNSLLSGPRTHVVNFVGNALTTAMSFPELATTAAIGKLTRSRDRALFGEVAARASGLADSSLDALRAMKTAFVTGEPVDGVAKVEARQHEAIGGKLGTIVRLPTRALTAADEFWKSILSHGELRQIAYRTAKRETSDPEAFKARYEALVRAPTEAMLNQAKLAARYWTFQKELGDAGRGVQQISNTWIGGKLLLPFVRTPINILKFAGERSVLAPMMPEVRQALRAGGRQRDEALARITLGSGLSTAAVVAAMEGRITGSGPTDSRERAALLQSGWQPNSIRIGNRWVSYARFDPASTLIGVAADLAEAGKWATSKEADAIALNLGLSIAKNITNKTWLSGLSDAFDVLSDPERYGKSYVQRLAGSMAVPAISAQTAQSMDPNLRDARTIMDAIKARVPVVSESLPVRRNVWGDPVSAGDAIGPDIISPFYTSRMSDDPVNKEITRLRAPISMPKRTITVGGKQIMLNAQQYDEMVQLSGKPAKQYLAETMRSADWRAMSDEERRETVKEALEDFRAAGRDALLERHPELAGGTAATSKASNDGLPPLPPGFMLKKSAVRSGR